MGEGRALDNSEDVSYWKEQVALAVRVLAREGLIAPFGHPSMRLPGSETVLILGHSHAQGKKLAETSSKEIVGIDMDGQVIDSDMEAPGERFIHTEIYRARSDVGSVVHAHPFSSVALGIVGQTVQPIWIFGTRFAQGVPLFEEAVQIDDDRTGKRLASVLGDCRAALLRGHGVVTAGATLTEACVDAVTLERTAQLQITAAGMGEVRTIPRDQLTEDLLTKGITVTEYYNDTWNYLTQDL